MKVLSIIVAILMYLMALGLMYFTTRNIHQSIETAVCVIIIGIIYYIAVMRTVEKVVNWINKYQITKK